MSSDETAGSPSPEEAKRRATAQAEKRIGTTLAGRYRVESLLGAGGMGAVFLAVQEPLERKVALKCIRSVLTDDELAVKRFIQEARAVSQLQHPNVVTLHDFGQDDDGTLFIAMELLSGQSLRQRIDAEGALLPAETVPMVRDVARALAQAHAAGVIHRDLKPDNVMLVELIGHGRTVKVVDFGVAKLAQTEASEALTGTGHVVGTPGYIAPEQMNGVLDDPRSDLYALGVVWFEALTGASPFEGETPMKKAFQHLTEAPPRPSDRREGVPAVIDELVLRLLEKRPEGRPPSAEALLELLDRLDAEGGGAPSATPASLGAAEATAEMSLLPGSSAERSSADDEQDDEPDDGVASTSELAEAGLARRPVPLAVLLGAMLLVGLILGFGTIWFLAGADGG